jgi:hypothetical protein
VRCAVTRATLALTTCLLVSGPALAAGAPVPAPELSTFPVSWSTRTLTAGVDGVLWAVERNGSEDRLLRFDRRGLRSTSHLPGRYTDVVSPLFPLPDGTTAVVAADRPSAPWAPAPTRVALVTFRGGDAFGRDRRLPPEARTASAFAVDSDGSVWFARPCADTLFHARPGELVRHRLRAVGCRRRQDRSAAAMAIGPDGAAWFVSLMQQRVARVDARGRVREWRIPHDPERDPSEDVALLPDPSGGIVFAGSADVTATGMVDASGRLVDLGPGPAVPVLGAAGRSWWTSVTNVVGRAPDGGVSSVTELGFSAAVARDRSGRPWYVTGVDRRTSEHADDVVGRLGREGSRSDARWSVTGVESVPPLHAARLPHLVLGGDGALWALRSTATQTVLVRVLPADIAAPRAPRARVERVTGRRGTAVWLRLACGADAGRFCRGNVRLGGALRSAPFAIGGGQQTTVRVTLGRSAARTLRRSGRLRLVATVSSAGTSKTRRTVTLRR